MYTLYTNSTSGLSLCTKVNSVYSPRFNETTPRVSSSSSRRAHRNGLYISRRRHPPVTKIQSLNLRSRTVKNRGRSSSNVTGIAIALYFFIAHLASYNKRTCLFILFLLGGRWGLRFLGDGLRGLDGEILHEVEGKGLDRVDILLRLSHVVVHVRDGGDAHHDTDDEHGVSIKRKHLMCNRRSILLSRNNCTHLSLTLLCARVVTTDELESLVPLRFALLMFRLDLDNLLECPGLGIVREYKNSS